MIKMRATAKIDLLNHPGVSIEVDITVSLDESLVNPSKAKDLASYPAEVAARAIARMHETVQQELKPSA